VPKYIARRGLQLGAETRYMGDGYSGVTNVEGIQDQGDRHRPLFAVLVHNQTLAPACNWRGT
jgi:LPS-assembly protein